MKKNTFNCILFIIFFFALATCEIWYALEHKGDIIAAAKRQEARLKADTLKKVVRLR
ncbi:MAG: hypothetical protein V4439_00420 [Patescibacteria group bacterium]